MNIEKLWDKYKDIIPYGVFGVLTTLVNIVSYWIFAHPFGLSVMVSTVLAWIYSVLFAYLTNRKWVFHSEASTKGRNRERDSFVFLLSSGYGNTGLGMYVYFC